MAEHRREAGRSAPGRRCRKCGLLLEADEFKYCSICEDAYDLGPVESAKDEDEGEDPFERIRGVMAGCEVTYQLGDGDDDTITVEGGEDDIWGDLTDDEEGLEDE